MKKTLALAAALFMTLALSASDSSAQGPLGTRYLSVSFGNLIPGNDQLKAVDDAIIQLDVNGNVPITANIDAFASVGYSQIKGRLPGDWLNVKSETKRIDAGAAYQFFPGQDFNPFVRGSIGYVSADAVNESTNLEAPGLPVGGGTEHDFAYSLGGGIEVPFAGQFLASTGFDYEKAGDVDDFVGFVDFVGRFNKVLFAGFGFSYGINEGDFSYASTIGFNF